MQTVFTVRFLKVLLVAASLTFYGCGGGGGGGGSTPSDNGGEPPPAPAPEPLTTNEASRFLSQATFGPSAESIDEVLSLGLEGWLLEQFDKSSPSHLETVLAGFPADGQFLDEDGMPLPGIVFLGAESFWDKAIKGEDQLRQRMAYALSQILVVSADSDLVRFPQTVAHYADILTEGVFGNYRDLLQNVTYSPAMAAYLTYLRNERANPDTGRVPDENYARELLQLFTLGLVELNPDGTPVAAGDGGQVELFDNSDITGLAKVFTGLSFTGTGFRVLQPLLPLDAYYTPLSMFDAFHSTEAKSFLGVTIPANTGGDESIDQALDAIFAHPNVGPFLGRQLIQRFVTSAPTPDYVERVAAAFDAGSFQLPGGDIVGSGQRGDLKAVIAAILLDPQARDAGVRDDPQFGKLREPVLRFTHWARAFNVNSADSSNELAIRGASRPDLLGQHPYQSRSVFNFYRPGYIAPGTETGAAGLTAPELQITNASTIIGYPNFITLYAFELSPVADSGAPKAFLGDYSAQAALADDSRALLDNLDELLTHGTLQDDTRDRITEVIEAIPGESDDIRLVKARVASVMVMTSPDYIVQR
jgi:uncharacterized protein (DUF1800 family)